MSRVIAAVAEQYDALSLYDSPYGAHDDGRAIDLYPDANPEGRSERAPSPVAGEVVAIERLRAPEKPYAPAEDVLLAIDTSAAENATRYANTDDAPIARILHVDPDVAVGDRVAVGDDLGDPIRSGFFAPWVGDHLHLEFRERDANLQRASGSLPLALDADVRAVPWDGRGTVQAVDETYAVLDRPAHPAPGECFAAIGAEIERDGDSIAGSDDLVPLDGGLPHYEFGGVLAGVDGAAPSDDRAVSLLGTRVGTLLDPETAKGDAASDDDTASDDAAAHPTTAAATHRPIDWRDVTVTVDGEPIHGLSLAAARDRLGTKLVCPDLDLAVGQTVTVAVETRS